MSRKGLDLEGETFNNWTVLYRDGSDDRGRSL